MIQSGGRVEVTAPELPAGHEAEVTVVFAGADERVDCLGAFADDADLMDEIVAHAMTAREQPLRR